jgi:hypothetical protein
LISHLVEFDARGLYLGAGYASLYVYCREVLRLSEYAAYHHIKATRAARRFPVILDKLTDGSLNLTTVRLLKQREVEHIVARLAPRPDAPSTIRKLPAPKPTVSVQAVT